MRRIRRVSRRSSPPRAVRARSRSRACEPAIPISKYAGRERVEAWRSSGLTAAQFTAQNGFSASALTGWSSKRRHRPVPRASGPAFVAVVRKFTAPAREFVVEVASAHVRVRASFELLGPQRAACYPQ